MDNENQQETPVDHIGNHEPHEKPKGLKKLIIIVFVILASALVAGAGSLYVLRQNSDAMALSQSIQNTLNQQQVKFLVQLSSPVSSSSPKEDLKVDGAYKKGSGLSANSESTVFNGGVKMIKQSRWVIDSSGTTYANLRLFDSKVVDGNPVLSTPENVQKMATATQQITKNNKDVWLKLEADDLKNGYTYGLQACTLSAFYKLQSDPKTFKEFVTKLADSQQLNIQKSPPVSGVSTYTITVNPDGYDDIGKLYTNSTLYKTLVGCDGSKYTATNQSIKETLKKTTITIKVDGAKKIVSSIAVSVKNGSNVNATLTPTSGVSIIKPDVTKSPPAATPTDTPASYLQRNSPYLYKNLMNLKDKIDSQYQQSN